MSDADREPFGKVRHMPEIVFNTLYVLLEQYDCDNVFDCIDIDSDPYASEWLDNQFTIIRRFLDSAPDRDSESTINREPVT